MPGISIDGRDAFRVSRNVKDIASALTKALAPALNRTADRMRTLAGRKASERYPLSTRVFGEFIRVKPATPGATSSQLELLARRISIQRFPVQVVDAGRGRYGIVVQRYRGGSFLPPQQAAGNPKPFPIHQRRAGKLRPSDGVRRRIGKDRKKLTSLKFFVFGKTFLSEILLPELKAEVPARLETELRSAMRIKRTT